MLSMSATTLALTERMKMETETRTLDQIAYDVYRHWPKVNYAALPYLDAMRGLRTLDDSYGYDNAASVVRYFLGNAQGWRGEEARRVKKELKAMLKEHSGY